VHDLGHGEKVPAPSKLNDVLAQPDYSDAVAILFGGVAEPKPHTVRINVTLPEDMLRKSDHGRECCSLCAYHARPEQGE